MKLRLPNLDTDISVFMKVKTVDVMSFTKHISLMLKSGIALAEAVDIFEKQTTIHSFKLVLQSIHDDISKGKTFHEALGKYPTIFDSFYTNLIRIAEDSGSLEKNLDYLASHLKKEHDFLLKVRSALLYPTIVLSVALIVGIGLSVFVLPQLVDLFASLDVELPLSTKILLFFAEVMRDYGILLLIGLIFFVLFFRFLITTKLFRPYWHTFILSLPVFGTYLQQIELATLFRNLGTMLGAGLPISAALEAQYKSSKNEVYKSILERIKAGVRKGKAIEQILSENDSKYFPLIAIRMISVGEKTGKLDETFVYLGEYFENEVDDTSKNLSTVLEPIILLLVGIVVAFVALSIIGPIYQFTGAIKR